MGRDVDMKHVVAGSGGRMHEELDYRLERRTPSGLHVARGRSEIVIPGGHADLRATRALMDLLRAIPSTS